MTSIFIVKIGPPDLENIFKFRQCIFAILLKPTLGKGRVPLYEQTQPRMPYDNIGLD